MMDGYWLFTGMVKYCCFGVLGALTARHVSDGPAVIAAGALGAVALSIVGSLLIDSLVYSFDGPARSGRGLAGIDRAVNTGFLMLVPVTLLALLSELALEWNAAQVFASAGIMTSGAAIGAGMAQGDREGAGTPGRGKLGFVSGLLPSVGAFALVGAWMALSLAARAWVG